MANKTNLPRRRFLAGMGGAAGALGAGGVGLSFSQRVDAGSIPAVSTKLLVYCFLRGGMDGLSFVIPRSGQNLTDYSAARDDTFVDPSLSLNLFNSGFGLHPNCSDLYSIRNKVAFVQACGHPLDALTRSHFDAQEQIELGTPGEQAGQVGFLTRYLQAIAHDPEATFTSMATSSNSPTSLNGYSDVANLESTSSFSPNSGTYGDSHLKMLREVYNGAGSLDAAGQATVAAVELINNLTLDEDYRANNGYPNTGTGRQLALVAQLWKENLGISVATLDRGGWDTHTDQSVLATGFGYGRNVLELSQALTAFYLDIQNSGRANDVAIVVQSEFGRQVSENGNRGTDHGYGNPMLVIGGRVVGGMYGSFPGIRASDRLGDSLAPTTDFRRVHSTVIDRIMGAGSQIPNIFPDYSGYVPMLFA